MAVESSKVAEYVSNKGHIVTLSSIANAFTVSVVGPNNTNIVRSYSDRKNAEIDYSFFVNNIQNDNM